MIFFLRTMNPTSEIVLYMTFATTVLNGIMMIWTHIKSNSFEMSCGKCAGGEGNCCVIKDDFAGNVTQ